jgi:ppGpp synthetase/RelA/SpoT-type nucleotidyltranferase
VIKEKRNDFVTNKAAFLKKHYLTEEDLQNYNIEWDVLLTIHNDFHNIKTQLEDQANYIANTLRNQEKVHTVKSRVKDPEHLIAKLIRKTPKKQSEKGNSFQFSVENYKDEITDLIGVRVIHIFKEDWETIHNFIKETWITTEIAANIRNGDSEKRFKELGIDISSRETGYRSVHYLIQFSPTIQKVVAEIQVRTIFEEGYGEIDHKLRYPHGSVPEVLALNLLLLNRVAGSSDEMASFINHLNSGWREMERKILKQSEEIEDLRDQIELSKSINEPEKETLMSYLQNIEGINFPSGNHVIKWPELSTLEQINPFSWLELSKDHQVEIVEKKENKKEM